MNKKISVIIPVYNTKKELTKCLESIANQTYRHLEIICVDDGSNDGSGKIADAFAGKDDRFKVIHQQNKGESGARNTGLKAATGDIIAFCDCDDWIEPDMYEALMHEISTYNLDMAAAGWFKESGEGEEIIRNAQPISDEVFGREQLLNYIYMRDCYRGMAYIWNKLYKKEILKDSDNSVLLFDEKLLLGGDVVFLAKAALNIKRAKYMERPFYHYVQREASGCHTKNVTRIRDWLKAYEIVIELFEEKKVDNNTIGYVKRFLAYHSSNAAEIAIHQEKAEAKREFQHFMKLYEKEYVELNSQYPERIERYYRLLKA